MREVISLHNVQAGGQMGNACRDLPVITYVPAAPACDVSHEDITVAMCEQGHHRLL